MDDLKTIYYNGTFFPAGVYRNGNFPGDWCTDDFLVFSNSLDPKNTPGLMNPSAVCTGMSGLMTAHGSDVATDIGLTLTGTQLPPSELPYFIGSTTQGFIAMPGGSSGNLCVIGTIARFNAQIGQISATGEFSIVVDTQNISAAPIVAILAGDTLSFQCWFRDANPGPTSNFVPVQGGQSALMASGGGGGDDSGAAIRLKPGSAAREQAPNRP